MGGHAADVCLTAREARGKGINEPDAMTPRTAPHISIVTVTFNAARFVKPFCEAVASFRSAGLETIVVAWRGLIPSRKAGKTPVSQYLTTGLPSAPLMMEKNLDLKRFVSIS